MQNVSLSKFGEITCLIRYLGFLRGMAIYLLYLLIQENMKKQLLSSALAVGTLTTAALVQANPAEAFSLYIDPQFGSTENTGATARLDYNFTQSGNNVLLNLGITNTTDGSKGFGATQSTLVGAALDLKAGDVTDFTYNALASAFTRVFQNVDISGLANGFDIGIRSQGSGNTFVGGNPQQGLTAGQSTQVQFTLFNNNGALNAAAVEAALLGGYKSGVLMAAGRFQQVNTGGGSDKVLAGTTSHQSVEPQAWRN